MLFTTGISRAAQAGAVLALMALGVSSLSPAALAGTHDGRAMLPEAEQGDWLAIGRLNVAPGKKYCTATLVAPDVVLTAAHCVINPQTERPYAVERLHFLAGFRQSRFAAHGRAAEVEIAGEYLSGGGILRRDLALVHLETPIADHVEPIPLAPQQRLDDIQEVDVYSYGRDRAFIMSVEENCDIVSRLSTALLTDCEALPGVSGAPLITESSNGPILAGVMVGARASSQVAGSIGGAAVAVDPKAFSDLLGDL